MIDRTAIKLDGLKGPEGLITAALGLAILEGEHPDIILRFAHGWGAHGAIDDRYLNKLDGEYDDLLEYHQQKKPKKVHVAQAKHNDPPAKIVAEQIPLFVLPQIPHTPRPRIHLHLTVTSTISMNKQMELAI